MHIKCFLDAGKIYDAKVLAISPDVVLNIFNAFIQNVTSPSLASGYIVSSAVPHLVLNAFKNLAAASFTSGISFVQAQALKASAGSRLAAAGGANAAAAAPIKEEEPEPEEDVDMGDLFGGDY